MRVEALAGQSTVIDLQADQLAQQGRLFRLRHAGEEVLDARTLAGFPGGLEAVALPLCAVDPGGLNGCRVWSLGSSHGRVSSPQCFLGYRGNALRSNRAWGGIPGLVLAWIIGGRTLGQRFFPEPVGLRAQLSSLFQEGRGRSSGCS
jgi:hypothetical protein